MFVNWLSGNPDCDIDFKAGILNIFELDRFTSDELYTFVRKSSLYSDKDLFDALAQKNVLLKEKHETQKKYSAGMKDVGLNDFIGVTSKKKKKESI